jgi:exosortase/archaeosortase family protein
MKTSMSSLAVKLFSAENRPKIFYLSALIPLVSLSYSYAEAVIGLVIPFYGFILLVLKKPKLFSQPVSGTLQRLLGFIVIVVSFFAYYFVSLFLPNAVFYGFANYFLFNVGLFLFFFSFRALKEAFSPLFLVVAFVTSSFVSNLVGSLFTPFISQFTAFIANVLRALGMEIVYSPSSPNLIVLNSPNGYMALSIVWACVGFTTIYMFSVILIVIMLEDPSSIRTGVAWATIGVLGSVLIGVIRLILVFVGYYVYGYVEGETVHSFIGYILFVMWTVVFLFLYFNRDTISQRLRSLFTKSRESNLATF